MLKETVVGGELAEMVDQKRRRRLDDLRDRVERHLAAGGRGRGRQIERDSEPSDFCRSGSASRMTRYWFDCVKMVETMRWPKAS